MHPWFAVAASGLLLAACSPQGQSALQASVAGDETASTTVAASAGGIFGTYPQPLQAQAAIEQVVASTFTPPKNTPQPVARPDFGDRIALAAVAPAATLPATVTAYASTDQGQSATADSSAAAEPAARARSIAAYERVEAGIDIDPAEGGRVQVAAVPADSVVPGSPRASDATSPLRSGLSSNGIPFNDGSKKGSGQRWVAAYPNVETDCFPIDLRNALDTIASHFGATVEVTSGYRNRGRRHSLHRSCMAADIRVAGVSPGTVASYAKTVPGVNGVGTYHWVAVTHVDTRAERFAWRY
ncbi:D-Ala-D-Ala carboxypeptidase family metallohydrolase [Roseiarcaceae bacterium H3SJ34-1]|uniref:YcbK family protein n=1 Tax=Terripilifer ovatus TaxID=3032367 RepID=UPI003AB93265|nr:D-Ala-D-Ala carboxypeptidase family metallohydrolase [Roseiarcaceae bacterium H3SJ34-1]